MTVTSTVAVKGVTRQSMTDIIVISGTVNGVDIMASGSFAQLTASPVPSDQKAYCESVLLAAAPPVRLDLGLSFAQDVVIR